MSVSSASSAPSAPAASSSVASPVLAEVVRSGFVEGRHRGSLVLLGADGSVEFAAGDVRSPIFPRSSNKPMQAAGVLRAGLELKGERLALAAASHSGETFHLDLVRTMLDEHGLSPEQLQCPPDLPLDQEEKERYLASGAVRDRVVMNCSGKHTAMLAACALRGWPLESYLDPEHPLQQLIHRSVEEAAGEPVAAVGTDGCGAPLMAISLTGLARAFRSYVLAEPGTAERRVADAMRAHPHLVGGRGPERDDTRLMQGVPGLLAKGGAEGVLVVAMPGVGAVAVKIDDGSKRPLGPVVVAALRRLGVGAPVLDELASGATATVYGGGEPVGAVLAQRAVVGAHLDQ